MDSYLLDLEEELGFTNFRKHYVVAEELEESNLKVIIKLAIRHFISIIR